MSRHLTKCVRLDSATPLSRRKCKTGGFASLSRDRFAFVVDATVLRLSQTVNVSLIADTRLSAECDVRHTSECVSGRHSAN